MIIRLATIALFALSLDVSAATNWTVDESGIGYVDSFDTDSDPAMADVIVSVGGIKQIIFRVKPLNADSCKPQGQKNGDAGYIVKEKIFVNNTVVHTKKFIMPSNQLCFIHYTGETKLDKDFITAQFNNGSKVMVEIGGADKGLATKYRGEVVVVAGIANLDGSAMTVRVASDTSGQQRIYETVPSSYIRWYAFSTSGFKQIWANSK